MPAQGARDDGGGRRQRLRLVKTTGLAVLLLFGSGCLTRRATEADLQESKKLLRSEKYDLALSGVVAALGRTARDPVLHWKLVFLKSEILLARREAAKALVELKVAPPTDLAWDEAGARYLLLLANAHYFLSKYADSWRFLDQAGKAAGALHSPLLTAEIEIRRGSLLVRKSDFAGATAALRHAYELASREGDRYIQAMATGNLGFLLLNAARYDEAITALERARADFQLLGGSTSVARAAGNLGWCYFRLGDFGRAQERLREAQQTFSQIGNQFEEQIWIGNEGDVLFTLRDFPAAKEKYQRALEVARKVGNNLWIARWLSNLANTAVESNNLDAAEEFNQEAIALKLKIGEKRTLIYGINNEARIAAARKQFTAAESLFRKASESETDDLTAVLEAHSGLAALYMEKGELPAAFRQFRRTLALLDQQRSSLLKEEYRISYLSGLIRFYQQYVDALMSQGKHTEALQIAESSRARVLRERARVTASGALLVGLPAPRTAGDVLLSYWLAPKRSFVWAVTGAGIRSFELPPSSVICPVVENYDALIRGQRDPLASEQPSGGRLFEMLIAPIRPLLRPGSLVTVTPDACLHSLNLETLPIPGSPGRYWIEEVTMRVLPALLLSRPAHKLPDRKAMLLMGDVDARGAGFDKLEFAGAEISAIEQAMPEAGRTVIRGPAATPPAYLEAEPGKFRFIHFVAHAVASRDSPLDSAVILAGPADACKLFARDVSKTPLSAELVTLSACRGAGARIYAGEGLVGFAWAFLNAGARNVIAGLWDVEDRSTSVLMKSLYQGMARGLTPPDALRSAKLDMIRAGGTLRKPYYWAPFQVYSLGGS